jgi:hypothetical protein
MRLARAAVAILNSLEAAKTRLDEINTRLTTPL